MPNTPKGGGISRKIFNSLDRQKIRNILNEINIPKSMGVIVRTAGANKTKNEIEKDFNNTLKTWEDIRDKALISNAPSLVYEEGDIIKRTLEIFMIMIPKRYSSRVTRHTKKQKNL